MLVGFIEHIGANTEFGHYTVTMRKSVLINHDLYQVPMDLKNAPLQNQWIKFDDSKVN